jgi:hypothetical protein
MVAKHGLTEAWHVPKVRAIDDRIQVEIVKGDSPDWFVEKVCPPLRSAEDRLFMDSTGVGGWGIDPPAPPMQTRAAAAKNKAVRVLDVLFHNLGTDEIENIGKATDYQEAITLARRLGKVPNGWNVAGTEKDEEHIIIVCKKGKIVAGDGVASAVTAKKPKPKKVLVLPEKLAGQPKNPDAAFAPRQPVPEVPGTLNVEVPATLFSGCRIRPLDPAVGYWDIKIDILREQVKEVRVRKDVFGLELLAIAFQGIILYDQEKVRIVVKPLKLENGAIYRIERVSLKAHLALTVHFWDGTTRRCGVEVFRSATLKEIIDQTRLKLLDEPLEEDQVYEILHNSMQACQPWLQKAYELKPKIQTCGVGVVRSKFGDMTVSLSILQKSRWLAIVQEHMPEPPLSIVELGDLRFYASYADDEKIFHVRFMTEDEGEEHLVSLLPCWENQVLKIRLAFGREMIPDDSRPSKDDAIYVKSADGSPPDPTFDRIMVYTLGSDSSEFQIRVHKGTTTQEVKSEIARIHPGCRPEQILFEGSAMTDEDPVTDWATVTGTSPLRVQIKLGAPTQWLRLWEPLGLKDLGEIELDARSYQATWREIRLNHPTLLGSENYTLYQGQEEVRWENLPIPDVTAVPKVIPTPSRGASFNISEKLQVPPPRDVGPLVQANLQVFTMEGSEVTEVMGVVIPNEITLAQLVTYCVLPTGMELDVDSAFYWYLPRVEDRNEKDKSRWKVEEIPDKIPLGFTLKVKCSSLHDGSTKQLAHCRLGDVLMHFSLAPDAKLERLKGRLSEWLRLRGQGADSLGILMK